MIWTLTWAALAAALCTLAGYCAASGLWDGCLAALGAAGYSAWQARAELRGARRA